MVSASIGTALSVVKMPHPGAIESMEGSHLDMDSAAAANGHARGRVNAHAANTVDPFLIVRQKFVLHPPQPPLYPNLFFSKQIFTPLFYNQIMSFYMYMHAHARTHTHNPNSI